MGRRKLSDDEYAGIVQGRREGMTLESLAMLYDCSTTLVERICQRAGVHIRAHDYEVNGTHYEHISDNDPYGMYIMHIRKAD